MDFKPDADFIAKKRRYIKRKKQTRKVIIACLCIAILLVWIIIVLLLGNVRKRLSDEPETAPMTTQEVITTMAQVTEPIGLFDGETEKLEIEASTVGKGALILVSDYLGYPYAGGKIEKITLWGNKSNTYRIASSSLSLERDAFMALDKMFSDYNKQTGNKDYQVTMAYTDSENPLCCAEHESGYALDVNVYTANGVSYRLSEAKEVDTTYSWIYDNAKDYGFVLRYPENKSGVTGNDGDSDHFRYVGMGHSQYMTEHDVVLEEYLGMLTLYPYDGEHLSFSYGTVDYEVFYVKIPSAEQSVIIDIPKDVAYTLSGDNIGGVIVTLYK